ncbi:MAG TPA: ABC transporter permease [Vicinamibacterales bacterium]|nr:ABC transporter permease [Vicinamibacterales bacterium]
MRYSIPGSTLSTPPGIRLDSLVQDVRYAWRMLHKYPGFALAALLTLGLGIGVNTAVFSVVNAVVLRPLPVRDGDRLVVIASQRTSSRTLRGVSFADLQDYRPAAVDVFEDIAGYSVGFLGLASFGSEPERVLVTWVTGNYFPLLDVRPALGRVLRADEGGPGRIDPVVVLGYSTWQRRFGGDPSVVGRSVMVNGRPCTVVGVAPPDFTGTFAFSESELYLPLNWRSGDGFDDRQARGLHAIARLRAGVTIDNAQAVMNVVARRLSRQYPDSNANLGIRVVPERLARPEEDQFRTNALGAAIILTMVSLVMIVAAVNVTNLLLARAASRQRELAIRAALGAGRGRLVRQMVTESLVLAMLGGGIGVVLGTWVARALGAMRLPGDLPVRFDFRLDGRVLAYSVTVALVTGLVVGFASAVRASGADPDRMLRGSRPGPSSAHRHGIRGFLVVAQISCCFVLLSMAGLFVRSLAEAERTDLGFKPEGVLNVHMDVGQLGYSQAQGRGFFDDVDRRIRSIPGVQNVSFAFTIPMGYIRISTAIEPEGQPVERDSRWSAGQNIVSTEYFQTMGIQIVRGRSFGDADHQRSRRVAIVNQRLANMLWPGQDPIGRRFKSPGPDASWLEVVGVTATGKYQFLFEDPQPYFYVPIAQEYTGLRVLHIRALTPADALAPAVERVIRGLEPDLPLYDVQSMTQALGSGLGLFPVRVGAIAVAAFGVLAFALAIVGLYGVTSYLTSQRTHEIGVRIAVGATRQRIVRLVLEDGARLVILGVAAGVVMTLACSRVVDSFLFGVSAYDPLTLVSVVPVLGGGALIACAIPAWRAARMDPTVALRSE